MEPTNKKYLCLVEPIEHSKLRERFICSRERERAHIRERVLSAQGRGTRIHIPNKRKVIGKPHSLGYLDSLHLSATKRGNILGFLGILKDYPIQTPPLNS
jgi:hypothetical protein